MSKSFKILIGLLFAFNIISAQTSREIKTYKNKNYSIDYFEPWELNNTGQNRTEFFFYTPLSDKNDRFNENINLLIQNQKGRNITLDEYVKISEDQISTVVVNGKVIKSERVLGKNYPYHKLEFSGSQGDFNLHFLQYYWLIDEQSYILTFTAESENYETYVKDAEIILQSFKLD